MEYSQIILNLLKEKGISRYRVAKDTGISESLFSKWEAHPTSEISSRVLKQLSSYLECSIDYLLGRETNKELTKTEKKLIDDYRSLSDQGKEYILQTMNMAAATYKKDILSPVSEEIAN